MSTINERKTFISYSRKDKDFAIEFVREMKSAGYSVWLDQLDIPTGARWDDEVERSLRECEIFLIILTAASVSSNNVKDEIGYAIDHGKRIMPVLLENCDVPLRLRRFQYVDFTTVEFNEGIKRAKHLLETLLTEPSAPVMTSNPRLEPQQSSGRKVAPAPSLPTKIKSHQRRWVSVGVGLLMCAACFGVLGALFIFRDSIFPLTPAQGPMATMTIVPTATELHTETPYPTFTPFPTVVLLTDTPPPTASPIVVSNTYNILQDGGIPGTQRSTPLDYTITVRTVDFLQIVFSIGEGGCSDIFLHILWDGNQKLITDRIGAVSGRYSTGVIELSQYISQGTHQLTISPEGVSGGCNVGTLGSYRATLIVYTNEYP